MAGTSINVSSFEAAQSTCCAKCGTVEPGDPCFEFCTADIGEGCCRIDEPCYPPEGGCPDVNGISYSWNFDNCHCESDMIETDPCAFFNSELNPASQSSICNGCSNGTATSYQLNFCDCCPDDPVNPNWGGPGGPNTDWEGPGKAPLASKKKPSSIPQEKPLRTKEKTLRESVIKRMQKLANIKKK